MRIIRLVRTMEDDQHEHNASPQHHVVINNDPALDTAREHHHTHLHHSAHAEEGRHDDLMYSKGTTDERSIIPHQDHQDHNIERRKKAVVSGANPEITESAMDTEKATYSSEESDPQSHRLSSFYRKYRLFFHLIIWLVFTG